MKYLIWVLGFYSFFFRFQNFSEFSEIFTNLENFLLVLCNSVLFYSPRNCFPCRSKRSIFWQQLCWYFSGLFDFFGFGQEQIWGENCQCNFHGCGLVWGIDSQLFKVKPWQKRSYKFYGRFEDGDECSCIFFWFIVAVATKQRFCNFIIYFCWSEVCRVLWPLQKEMWEIWQIFCMAFLQQFWELIGYFLGVIVQTWSQLEL